MNERRASTRRPKIRIALLRLVRAAAQPVVVVTAVLSLVQVYPLLSTFHQVISHSLLQE